MHTDKVTPRQGKRAYKGPNPEVWSPYNRLEPRVGLKTQWIKSSTWTMDMDRQAT